MNILECSNFHEVISKRREDAPLAIVAGWFMPNGEPRGAVATMAEVTPTAGEMAVSYACCLAACFKKIEELLEQNPGQRDQLMQLVFHMTEGLEVAERFKSGLVSGKALAGAGGKRKRSAI